MTNLNLFELIEFKQNLNWRLQVGLQTQSMKGTAIPFMQDLYILQGKGLSLIPTPVERTRGVEFQP